MSHAIRRGSRGTQSAGSSWLPTDLADLIAWVDASDTATITLSGSDATAWADKSGNGNNLTGTGYAQSGTRTQNGLNVLDFATSDLMLLDIADDSQPFTVYWAGATDNAGLANQWVLGGPTFSPITSVWSLGGVSSGVTATTSFTMLAAKVNGASSKGWVNTTSFTGDMGATALTALAVGNRTTGGRPMDGMVGEVIWCSTGHDDATVSDVWDYLQAKWSI